MKLLQPQQTKDAQAEVLQRDLIRTKELNAAAAQARKNLANAEADFNLVLAKNNAVWAQQEEEHLKRVNEMKTEIDALEVKRLNFMIPLDILNKSTDERFKEAEKFLLELRERESTVEETAEKLEDKLDAVGKREQDLLKRELDVKLKISGAAQQAANAILGTQQLNKAVEDFKREREKIEKNLEERKVAAFLLEQTLTAKEDSIKRTVKAQEELGRRLQDERGTLQRAWTELERLRKHISP